MVSAKDVVPQVKGGFFETPYTGLLLDASSVVLYTAFVRFFTTDYSSSNLDSEISVSVSLNLFLFQETTFSPAHNLQSVLFLHLKAYPRFAACSWRSEDNFGRSKCLLDQRYAWTKGMHHHHMALLLKALT